MGWSDAARAAAAEARKRKATTTVKVMDPKTGSSRHLTRVGLAGEIKTIRAQIRQGLYKKKMDIKQITAKMANYRHAAKTSTRLLKGR